MHAFGLHTENPLRQRASIWVERPLTDGEAVSPVQFQNESVLTNNAGEGYVRCVWHVHLTQHVRHCQTVHATPSTRCHAQHGQVLLMQPVHRWSPGSQRACTALSHVQQQWHALLQASYLTNDIVYRRTSLTELLSTNSFYVTF